ncbi:alpha/beta hydrolase [Hoeflea sp.]|uniref:alpha/beta hydrolase n=1 Tax=Hoeflea sp. TaxID=1940281 RepID=UPI003B017F9D
MKLLRITAITFALAAMTTAFASESIKLRPHKDKLFSYPSVLESRDGGAFLKIDYRAERDINKRDQVPEVRAHRSYVSLRPKRQQRAITIRASDIAVEAYEVGASKKAKFAVIFIHGRGGDRRLGVKDWTFGGNFNRLKNLAVKNGGVYYAPTIPSFDRTGLEHLKTLVTYIRRTAPNAPVILACGSMGSMLCWQGSNDPGISSRLAGIAILGGTGDESFLRSAAYHAGVPVLLAHGSRDSVYDWRGQHALYERVRFASNRPYPIRFVLFQSGSHGTPIRMVDWRETLNWMLSNAG